MLRLMVMLISVTFLLWGATSAMALHDGGTMDCAVSCKDCAAADDAVQGHDVVCAACPAVGSILPGVLVLSNPVEHRDMLAVPGRLLVAEPALVSDPPPPRP